MLHYGQQVEYSTLAPLWDQLKTSCDFANARKEVEQFNSQNRWRKRGVAMVPTKFGISFTLKLMNQVGKDLLKIPCYYLGNISSIRSLTSYILLTVGRCSGSCLY